MSTATKSAVSAVVSPGKRTVQVRSEVVGAMGCYRDVRCTRAGCPSPAAAVLSPTTRYFTAFECLHCRKQFTADEVVRAAQRESQPLVTLERR